MIVCDESVGVVGGRGGGGGLGVRETIGNLLKVQTLTWISKSNGIIRELPLSLNKVVHSI